jgi:hypothetical protein
MERTAPVDVAKPQHRRLAPATTSMPATPDDARDACDACDACDTCDTRDVGWLTPRRRYVTPRCRVIDAATRCG